MNGDGAEDKNFKEKENIGAEQRVMVLKTRILKKKKI
jgi:hypothetical protein